MKIKKGDKHVTFWGTGQETRDFIHIGDVLSLFNFLLTINQKLLVINGGLGNRFTIKEIITMIRNIINPKVKINFKK